MPEPVPPILTHRAHVDIDAAAPAVWAFVSDSARASLWSVYFHHIAPLPESPVPDGRVGSLRRCYRRADASGVVWDEEVVAIVPERYREIRSFRLRGFRAAMQPAARLTEYRVAQHVEPLGPARTRLTFSTSLLRPDLRLARWTFGFFARDVVRVFRLNLENIRAAVEAEAQGVAYQRLHPYELTHPWD
jgi:hypothetical protein